MQRSGRAQALSRRPRAMWQAGGAQAPRRPKHPNYTPSSSSPGPAPGRPGAEGPAGGQGNVDGCQREEGSTEGVRWDTMDTMEPGLPSGARVRECRGEGLAQGRSHSGHGRGSGREQSSGAGPRARGEGVRANAGGSGAVWALRGCSGAHRRSAGAQGLCSAQQALSHWGLAGCAALEGPSGAQKARRGRAVLRGT